MSAANSNVVQPGPSVWGRVRDSYVNFTARIGLGQQNQFSAGSYQFDFLSRNRIQLEAMYRSSWICRAAVDTVAEDMTKAGVEFKGTMEPTKIHELLDHLETELVIWDQLTDGGKWARLYGGSLVVMMIDGQDFSTPLRIESVGKNQFKGLLALDRWMVQPSLSNLVQEYGPYLGKPVFYDTVVDAPGIPRMKVHYSRVIRLEGPRLPYYQKMTENGWGQSVMEVIHDRLQAFDSATLGMAQLVFKAHLRTVKFKDFRNAVASGGKSLDGIIKTVEMMRMTQSNEGITVADLEDVIESQQYGFSGLSEVIAQLAEQVSGALQIPLVRLFGRPPGGLNASGESDLRTYYDGIARQQKVLFRSGMSVLWKVAHRSLFGIDMPEGTQWNFAPLYDMTAKEKSDTATAITGAVVQAEEAGIVTRATALRELKQSSDATGLWSNITDEEIKDAENDPLPSELKNAALEGMNDIGTGDPGDDDTNSPPEDKTGLADRGGPP